MANFTVKMKDGTVREFRAMGRAGGSYQNGVRYENGFVVFFDEWNGETVIPSDLIEEIIKSATGGW